MKKQKLSLMILLTLGLSASQHAAAQTDPAAPAVTPVVTPASPLQAPTAAPADPRLPVSNVSLQIGAYAGPLSSLLAAVARSAGYDIVFETNIDTLQQTQGATSIPASAGAAVNAVPGASVATSTKGQVVYNFRNTPFNQVWPLLMDLYGLSYDVTMVGQTPVLRVGTAPVQDVITLKNASAADAVNQIKLFFGTPTYSETQVKDAQGNITGVTRTLSDVKLDSTTLRIVPDVRANTLIVRGTSREVNDVRRLAAQFDSQVKIADSVVSSPIENIQQVYTVKGQQSDILAVFQAQYPGLKVTPVGTTGQLILQGPKNVVEAAVNLVGTVDRPTPVVTVVPPPPAPGIVQRVFALQNAQAVDLKVVLQGALATAAITATAAPAPAPVVNANGTVTLPVTPAATAAATPSITAAPVTAASGAVTILADERTNTLVVRGTQAQVDQIAELIPAFDLRVPQINLQVRIQEINESGSRALGVDWKAGIGSFVVNLASTAVKAIFDPTQALAGFNLGATLNALENQGVTKRVYDGSVTMQSGQKGLRENTPFEQPRDIEAAHIQTGGRIELNIPSAAANVPSIQRQIDYGVTLNFYNPQVAPDGTITVRVQGRVAGAPADITNPQLLQYTNSEAQTTLSFKSGDTVLLSGLMGTNTGTTSSGVPFLSSIPVIGALFGKTTTSTSRSQLLVVLTGDIVK